MTSAPVRTGDERRRDTLARLEQDVDVWVATADGEGGTPYLVPLSFLWDGTSLLLATAEANPTARNLRATGRVRLALGHTRDVVMVEGTVQPVAVADLPEAEGDAFAAKTGFDPRALRSRYVYFRVAPRSVQAWREVDELVGRDLMDDGHWTV
jgi:nitroimidazol reductase NimA-like FMN-containing flavoprotein (pyridoxamine 5'-phosphate oxidase superfamily)